MQMGYYVDWASVAGLDKDEVLRRLNLVDTGEEQDWPDRKGCVWGVDRDGRVTVITDDYGSFTPDRLAMLSQGASLVGGSAESNACTCSVWGYIDGARRWAVAVGENTTDDPLAAFTAEGDLPSEYGPLYEDALRRLEADPDTAFIEEVPLDLAAAVGAWRPEGSDEPRLFRAVRRQPDVLAQGRKRWFQFFRS